MTHFWVKFWLRISEKKLHYINSILLQFEKNAFENLSFVRFILINVFFWSVVNLTGIIDETFFFITKKGLCEFFDLRFSLNFFTIA